MPSSHAQSLFFFASYLSLVARERLRDDKSVVAALDDAWDRLRAARGGADGTAILRDQYGTLSRKLYLLFKAQRFDGYLDAEECEAECERDWATDACGKAELTRADFDRAFFQLADVHTDSVDAPTYLEYRMPSDRRDLCCRERR